MTDQDYKILVESEYQKLEEAVLDKTQAQIQLSNAAMHYTKAVNKQNQINREKKIKLGPTYEEAMLEVEVAGWEPAQKAEGYRVFEDDHVTWRFPYEKGYVKVDYQVIDNEIRIQTRYICPPPWELQ